MLTLILAAMFLAAFVGLLKLIWWVTKVWLKLTFVILEIVLVLLAVAILL